MRLFSLCLSCLLLSCEVGSVREERRAPKQDPVAPSATPAPIVPALPVAPKEEPRGLKAAMLYTLPGSTGIFVIDTKRLLSGSVVRSFSSDLVALLSMSREWQLLQSATGLDPLLDVHGVVISYREVSGGSSEFVLALVGAFAPAGIAEKSKAASRHAEASGDVLLVGAPPLLTEAKASAEEDAFETSPVLATLLASVDTSRPLYGAFLPPKASSGAVDKANQVTLALDFEGVLHLKSTMLFSSNTEAEAARSDIQSGVTQMTPSLSMLGISDPAKFTSAISVAVVANQLTLLVSIDEATAITMLKTMIGLSKGAVPTPSLAPPAPPVMPPVAPPVTPG